MEFIRPLTTCLGALWVSKLPVVHGCARGNCGTFPHHAMQISTEVVTAAARTLANYSPHGAQRLIIRQRILMVMAWSAVPIWV